MSHIIYCESHLFYQQDRKGDTDTQTHRHTDTQTHKTTTVTLAAHARRGLIISLSNRMFRHCPAGQRPIIDVDAVPKDTGRGYPSSRTRVCAGPGYNSAHVQYADRHIRIVITSRMLSIMGRA